MDQLNSPTHHKKVKLLPTLHFLFSVYRHLG